MTIKNAAVLIEFEEVEGTRVVILNEDQQEALISLIHYIATPLLVTDEVYDSIKFVSTDTKSDIRVVTNTN